MLRNRTQHEYVPFRYRLKQMGCKPHATARWFFPGNGLFAARFPAAKCPQPTALPQFLRIAPLAALLAASNRPTYRVGVRQAVLREHFVASILRPFHCQESSGWRFGSTRLCWSD